MDYTLSVCNQMQYYVINVNIVPTKIFSFEKNKEISFRVPSFIIRAQ